MGLTTLHALEYPDATDPIADYPPIAELLAKFVDRRIGKIVTVAEFAALVPADGMEVYLLADATNRVVWHLRYNAALAPTNPWEFLGGPPISAYADAISNRTGGSGTYSDLDAGAVPAISIPRAGEYYVRAGSKLVYSGGVWGGANMGLEYPGGSYRPWLSAIDGDYKQSGAVGRRIAGVGVGTMKLSFMFSGSPGPMPVSYRWLEAIPVRLT